MSAVPPIPMTWDGEHMVPLQRFAKVCDQHFAIGQVYPMLEHQDRSIASHNHEFAFLKEAWMQLPDELVEEYPSPEALRKRALIRTGWRTTQDYPCASRAEAARWAANLRRVLDEYAVIVVSESVVRVHQAKSQARNAMGREDFQASKTAVLEWVAQLIGVEPQALLQARAA